LMFRKTWPWPIAGQRRRRRRERDRTIVLRTAGRRRGCAEIGGARGNGPGSSQNAAVCDCPRRTRTH
jgi:hypothetical protein